MTATALLKATPDEIDTNCVVSGWVRTKQIQKRDSHFLPLTTARPLIPSKWSLTSPYQTPI